MLHREALNKSVPNPQRSTKEALELAIQEFDKGNYFRAMHAASEAALKTERDWQTHYGE